MMVPSLWASVQFKWVHLCQVHKTESSTELEPCKDSWYHSAHLKSSLHSCSLIQIHCLLKAEPNISPSANALISLVPTYVFTEDLPCAVLLENQDKSDPALSLQSCQLGGMDRHSSTAHHCNSARTMTGHYPRVSPALDLALPPWSSQISNLYHDTLQQRCSLCVPWIVSYVHAFTCPTWWEVPIHSTQISFYLQVFANCILVCGWSGCLSFSSRKLPGPGGWVSVWHDSGPLNYCWGLSISFWHN